MSGTFEPPMTSCWMRSSGRTSGPCNSGSSSCSSCTARCASSSEPSAARRSSRCSFIRAVALNAYDRMPARHFADNEATISVGLRVTGAQNSYLAVPVSLIRDSRRSGASRRTRSVALAVIFYLAMPPAGIAAQVPTTALAEFLPPPSFGVSRLDDTGLRDLSTTSSPENAERRGFSTGEVLDPIPKTSSINFQPTYVHRTDGTYQAYVQLKPVIVVESGLPLFTRIEWPIPEIDNENGPTNAGVGDLTWLTLLLLGSSKAWGALGIGPVLVFPTASHSEMGDGKYQAGPALGYINKAVPLAIRIPPPAVFLVCWGLPALERQSAHPAALRDQALARFVVRADAADHHPGLPQEREQCPQ